MDAGGVANGSGLANPSPSKSSFLSDQWHSWSAAQFATIRQLALTCDAVISEACFLLRGTPDSREKIFALIERGILRIVPILPDESAAIRTLGRVFKLDL